MGTVLLDLDPCVHADHGTFADVLVGEHPFSVNRTLSHDNEIAQTLQPLTPSER
jgi:hypothetical protein